MLIEDIQREKDSIATIVDVLVKICKAKGMMNGLKQLANDNILYHDNFRGMGQTKFIEMLDIVPRKKPTNTPLSIHNEYDAKLEDMFGIRFRTESLFTYPDKLSNIERNSSRKLIIIPTDSAKLLYSTSRISANDFYIRYSNKNREIVRNLSTSLRQEGVNKFKAGEIQAVMDISGNTMREIKAHDLSNVYAYAVKNYPEQSHIILKHYIQKLDRFLKNDAKKMKLTDISSLFSEIDNKPEVMVYDNSVLYLRTDELFYHIEEDVQEFKKELTDKINNS